MKNLNLTSISSILNFDTNKDNIPHPSLFTNILETQKFDFFHRKHSFENLIKKDKSQLFIINTLLENIPIDKSQRTHNIKCNYLTDFIGIMTRAGFKERFLEVENYGDDYKNSHQIYTKNKANIDNIYNQSINDKENLKNDFELESVVYNRFNKFNHNLMLISDNFNESNVFEKSDVNESNLNISDTDQNKNNNLQCRIKMKNVDAKAIFLINKFSKKKSEAQSLKCKLQKLNNLVKKQNNNINPSALNVLANNDLLSYYNENTCTCEFDGCGRTFKDKYKLADHLVVHSTLKQFSCTYADCDKKFKRKQTLNRHIKAFHKKITKHTCKYCDVVFVNYNCK